MNKLVIALLCVGTLVVTACTYDTKAYEEQRKYDNEAHDKQNGP